MRSIGMRFYFILLIDWDKKILRLKVVSLIWSDFLIPDYRWNE